MPVMQTFPCNGRYYTPPDRPLAVLCLDGCSDEYLNAALAHQRMPHVAEMILRGHRSVVRGALPSFTNVNNTCIITGVPPAITGISGNFFLDPETGEAVMMNSAAYLRCPTILAAAAAAGRRVAIVTAKDKLCSILSHELSGTGSICFSAEKADQAKKDTHGIDDVESLVGLPTPPIYSADASVYVLRAGVALIESGRADFLYLSTTDFIQHKHAPEEEEALAFMAAIDEQVGRLLNLGAVVGATADHGMNAKNDASGRPNILYLQECLDAQFGPGHRVICPVTDPYVRHHGGLGSMVSVHVAPNTSAEKIAAWVAEQTGITEVHDRIHAAHHLELPPDRIGDLVVLAGRDLVIGIRHEDHDLSQLNGSLRSHGGRYEEMVPMLLSERLQGTHAQMASQDPRNFDIFDFTCHAGGNRP